MIAKVKQLKPVVERLPIQVPHLRDSDEKLVATIWHIEIGKDSLHNGKTAMELLQDIATGKLSSADAITRVRRRLQEQNPELRGVAYNPRNKEQVVFRSEINNV